MVFYIEGEAKRFYNPMIRTRGPISDPEKYKVEERYGLWVCKDYIPIKKYNDWLELGKRLETKFHAFVNCQEFRLTANRGDIGNTSPDLLKAIQETDREIFYNEIIGSADYAEYEEAAELEGQYQTAEQEKKDFDRRRKRAKSKKVSVFNEIELLEPSTEMGVVSLFNLVYALKPGLFPFRIIDYDTKRGYDCLAAQNLPFDLTSESMFFVEFKNILPQEFNHSFEHLVAIICWDCNFQDGTEVEDIRDQKWKLHITPATTERGHTVFMLQSPIATHSIQVFVLKYYLEEKLGVNFVPRAKKQPVAKKT